MISEKYSVPKGWWRVVVFLGVFLSTTSAQVWGPDIRLTSDTAQSLLSDHNNRCVAAWGNNVHVVWADKRDGNMEIYYKHSTDNGSSWGEDTRLTSDTSGSYHPCIAVWGNNVYIVWRDNRNGNAEVYYKRSTDNGTIWGPDTRISPGDNYRSQEPSIAVWENDVHVIWRDEKEGNWDLYYQCSRNSGDSWEPYQKITHEEYLNNFQPIVAVQDNNIHVSWFKLGSWYDPMDIYYIGSANYGQNWENEIKLSIFEEELHEATTPEIAISGNNVHVVWADDRHDDGNTDIFYIRSADNGQIWEEETRFTNDPGWSSEPCIAAYLDTVYLAWYDGDGIYYKRLTENGVMMEPETLLIGTGSSPSLAVGEGYIHLVWQDSRDGNSEIYYKHGTLEGAIEENLPLTSKGHFLEVFCGIEPVIQYGIPKACRADIVIFDVSGCAVRTLISEEQFSGHYRISWDGCDDQGNHLSTGVYFCQLKVREHSITRKLVLLR